MWLLHLLPDSLIAWIVNLVFLAGAVITVAGFFVRFIPFVNQYRIPVQIAGILLLTTGVYFHGGYTTEMAWRERVREVEAKLAAAETRSAEVNTEIVTRIVTKTKLVTQRGDDIIRYVDREVVRDQEVIKFVENCPVPDVIVNTHNEAAMNRPNEEKK